MPRREDYGWGWAGRCYKSRTRQPILQPPTSHPRQREPAHGFELRDRLLLQRRCDLWQLAERVLVGSFFEGVVGGDLALVDELVEHGVDALHSVLASALNQAG